MRQRDAILERVTSSPYAPSKKLLEHVATMVHGKAQEYVLLREQRVAYQKIFTEAGKQLYPFGPALETDPRTV